MTETDCRTRILACETLTEAADFVRTNFDEVALLFYDVARSDLARTRIFQKKTFDLFVSGAAMQTAGGNPAKWPRPIIGLLVLFASFFERAGMYAELNDVVQWLPEGNAKEALQAITLYRRVNDCETGYKNVLERILTGLSKGIPNPTAEALLAEYFALASTDIARVAGVNGTQDFTRAFQEPDAVKKWPLLGTAGFKRLLKLAPENLEGELHRLNIQVVEAIFQIACEHVDPVAPTDPTISEVLTKETGLTVKLPTYLDDLLFKPGGLASIAGGERIAVRQGLQGTEQHQRGYLKRYFPRSFAESYAIHTGLFRQPGVHKNLVQKRGVLTILNIGSGTGGDLAGLLESLADAECRTPRLDIHSYEGNHHAIAFQKRILQEVATKRSINVNLHTYEKTFPTTRNEFEQTLAQELHRLDTSFDIAMSWKSFNEYYHATPASALGIYRAFIANVAPALTPAGLCILLDITDSVNDDKKRWFPIMMNAEIRNYLQKGTPLLGHVLPLSCAQWASTCQETQCYTQRVFTVTHTGEPDGKCRVAYVVMARKEVAEEWTRKHRHHTKFRCNTARPGKGCAKGILVNLTDPRTTPDGFELG